MALGRTLTKKLKDSVSKKLTQNNNQSQNDEFYAIGFNETDPDSKTPTIIRQASDSNFSHPSSATTTSVASVSSDIYQLQKAPILRTESLTSLLSRKSSMRKLKTPTASRSGSRPPSITSSPSTPTGYISEESVEDCASYSKPKNSETFISYQTILEDPNNQSLPPLQSVQSKPVQTHRKVTSSSSSATAASSCYSSIYSSTDQQSFNNTPSYFSHSGSKYNTVLEDDTFADEMAMEILEKVSAKDYVRALESDDWAL